jgi:hypothetical protein
MGEIFDVPEVENACANSTSERHPLFVVRAGLLLEGRLTQSNQ